MQCRVSDRSGARDIHLTGLRPRRSIRFVLFSGKEQGMLGSWAYARDHRAELDKTIAAILFDGGTGRALWIFAWRTARYRGRCVNRRQPLNSVGRRDEHLRRTTEHRQSSIFSSKACRI